MDPITATLIAAGIGAVATLVAALIGKKRRRANAPSDASSAPATPAVTLNVNAIVDQLVKAQEREVARFQEREQEAQDQIRALREAVTAVAKQKDQPDAPTTIDDALKELKQGRTAIAEAIFQEVLDRRAAEGEAANQQAAEAARHLGALAYLHDTQKALRAYRRAVELDPQNPEGWNQLGHLLRRVGELDEAETAYRKVLSLGESTKDPSVTAAAYGNLGLVYQTRGDAGLRFLRPRFLGPAAGHQGRWLDHHGQAVRPRHQGRRHLWRRLRHIYLRKTTVSKPSTTSRSGTRTSPSTTSFPARTAPPPAHLQRECRTALPGSPPPPENEFLALFNGTAKPAAGDLRSRPDRPTCREHHTGSTRISRQFTKLRVPP